MWKRNGNQHQGCHGQKRQKTFGLSAQLVQDIAKITKAESKAKEQAQEQVQVDAAASTAQEQPQAEGELIRLRQEMVVPLLVALEDKIKKLIPEVPLLSILGKALQVAAKVLPQGRNYAGSA